MNEPYEIILPEQSTEVAPVLISAPHVGTDFPEELRDKFNPEFVRYPRDTDWLVDQLYKFSSQNGITLIRAKYSRYVVDLNRAETSQRLYTDGRPETGVVPQNSFDGAPLYRNSPPSAQEVQSRLDKYHKPYYDKISSILETLQRTHPHVLFFDAHSIRRQVPRIQPEPFPDLILGDRDRTTAHPALSEAALAGLKGAGYDTEYNTPFKGGNLTQTIGKPAQGIHALQLEKSQDIYLTEGEPALHPEKAFQLSRVLEKVMLSLIPVLKGL